jgi:dihydrofolate reductase
VKLSVFCGISVDGFLARPDDALDFLDTGEQEPHGFMEFLASVDLVVIGRRTFEVVLKLGHLTLYGKKQLVVLSSRPLDFFRPNPVEASSAGYAAIAHNDDTFESRCCSQATSEYSDSSAALSMPDSRVFSCDHSIPPGDLA